MIYFQNIHDWESHKNLGGITGGINDCFFYFRSKGEGGSRPIQKILIRKYSDFFTKGHSRKKAGSRDPGSHDFSGKIRKNRKSSEKYFVGKFFQKLRKNTKKFGKIL